MLYAVVPLDPSPTFAKHLNELGDRVYKDYGPKVYFVSYTGTTRELANALNFQDGESGTGVVLPFSNYWGYASKDLWEWLHLRENGD